MTRESEPTVLGNGEYHVNVENYFQLLTRESEPTVLGIGEYIEQSCEMMSKQDEHTVRVNNEVEILTKQDEHTVRSDHHVDVRNEHHADVENEDELLTRESEPTLLGIG